MKFLVACLMLILFSLLSLAVAQDNSKRELFLSKIENKYNFKIHQKSYYYFIHYSQFFSCAMDKINIWIGEYTRKDSNSNHVVVISGLDKEDGNSVEFLKDYIATDKLIADTDDSLITYFQPTIFAELIVLDSNRNELFRDKELFGIKSPPSTTKANSVKYWETIRIDDSLHPILKCNQCALSINSDTLFIFDNYQNVIFIYNSVNGNLIRVFRMDSVLTRHYYNKKDAVNRYLWGESIKSKQYPQPISGIVNNDEENMVFALCGVNKEYIINRSFDKASNDSFVSSSYIKNGYLLSGLSFKDKDEIIEIDSIASNTDITNFISYNDKFLFSTLCQTQIGTFDVNIENYIFLDERGKVLSSVPITKDIKTALGVDSNTIITKSLMTNLGHRLFCLNFQNSLFFSFEIIGNKIDKLKTLSPFGSLNEGFKLNEFNKEIAKKYGAQYSLTKVYTVQSMTSDGKNIYIYLYKTQQMNKGQSGILQIYSAVGTHLKDIKINFRVDDQLQSSNLISVKNNKAVFFNKFKMSRWKIESCAIDD